ncbi:MAG: hypothetical protein HW380_1955 [Magnetococcales bacterium]|nr:hypothetical protein [Magnetococcales bacterium]HIJ83229.1 hypothetical protein [Magnetococcales bacterium]
MAMITASSVGLQNYSGKSDPIIKSLDDTFKQLSQGLKTRGQGSESAALIAIADRFTSQMQGANQARLQVNDAISLTQVADAALGSVETGFQRLQELATQSANSTLSDTDRQALQKEASTIQEQIQTIIADTSYNDVSLLSADQTLSFQTGPGANNQTGVQLRDFSTAFTQVDISTQAGGESAIQAANDALKRIGGQRAEFGAAEARFVSVADTLSQLSETISSAEGRISGSDMADKISNSIALAIRARASTALQTQADKLSSSRVQQLLQ